MRRVLCVRIADRTVYEWNHAAEGWTPLAPTDEISDRCFTVPIPAGAHRLRSDGARPFGVKVYGVARYTSYMYPGGLDLELITPG